MRAAIAAVLLGSVASGCYASRDARELRDRDPRDGGRAGSIDASRDGSIVGRTDGRVAPDAADPLACRALVPDAWLVPDAVHGDIPVGLRASAGVGCGCVPRIRVPNPARPTEILFEACACTDDDCVDGGYEVTALLAHEPADRVQLSEVTGGTRPHDVDVWADCSGTLPFHTHDGGAHLLSVEHLASRGFVRSGPPPVWLRVAWEVYACCGPPAVVGRIDDSISGAGIRVVLDTCHEPCDCAGRAPAWTRLETDIFAGYHRPGHYTVFVLGIGEEFVFDIEHR